MTKTKETLKGFEERFVLLFSCDVRKLLKNALIQFPQCLSSLGLSDPPLSTDRQPTVSHCMLSLNNRPLNASNGTLLVSLSSGRVQVWSHHEAREGYITDFDAIHVAGDVSKWLIDVHLACWSWCIHFSPTLFVSSNTRNCLFIFMLDDNDAQKKNKTILFSTMPRHFYFVHRFFSLPSTCYLLHRQMSVTAMTTDTQNCYLFTGSARGYIKAWMIINFWYVFNCLS